MHMFEVGEECSAAYAEKIASFLVMIKKIRINLELHSCICTCNVDTEEIFQVGWFIFCQTSMRHVNHLFSEAENKPVMGCICSYEESKWKCRIFIES